MPPPLTALATLAALPDSALTIPADLGGTKASIQFVLYDLVRHEQSFSTRSGSARSEIARTLDLAQMAYGELVGVLVGRSDERLDTAHDGEWSLRDVLRHAIAVELRYGAQIEYAARRTDQEPLAIPDDLLPCDRLSPPEPAFADTRVEGIARVLELLGHARASTDWRLESVGDATLGRPSLWGKRETTVRMRLHQVAVHLTEVVIQVEKCLGISLDAEARRILRHCCRARGAHERWSDPEARAKLDARYSALADG